MRATRNATRLTSECIRRAAIERLGVADANVVRYVDSQKQILMAEDDEPLTDCVGGTFYALAIKATAGEPFTVVARRRTKGELLAAIAAQNLS